MRIDGDGCWHWRMGIAGHEGGAWGMGKSKNKHIMFWEVWRLAWQKLIDIIQFVISIDVAPAIFTATSHWNDGSHTHTLERKHILQKSWKMISTCRIQIIPFALSLSLTRCRCKDSSFQFIERYPDDIVNALDGVFIMAVYTNFCEWECISRWLNEW